MRPGRRLLKTPPCKQPDDPHTNPHAHDRQQFPVELIFPQTALGLPARHTTPKEDPAEESAKPAGQVLFRLFLPAAAQSPAVRARLKRGRDLTPFGIARRRFRVIFGIFG